MTLLLSDDMLTILILEKVQIFMYQGERYVFYHF